MTLSFSQTINGKPNYFIEKIWEGLFTGQPITSAQYLDYANKYLSKFGKEWDGVDLERCWHEPVNPKIHTIRKDVHNRWVAGRDIHFVINPRSPNYFQFAPVFKCVSVQAIKIRYSKTEITVLVDNKMISGPSVQQLAINDGFDSMNDFFAYFNKDFTGKIIHWTDLTY